jgi:hypothetical protein
VRVIKNTNTRMAVPIAATTKKGADEASTTSVFSCATSLSAASVVSSVTVVVVDATGGVVSVGVLGGVVWAGWVVSSVTVVVVDATGGVVSGGVVWGEVWGEDWGVVSGGVVSGGVVSGSETGGLAGLVDVVGEVLSESAIEKSCVGTSVGCGCVSSSGVSSQMGLGHAGTGQQPWPFAE